MTGLSYSALSGRTVFLVGGVAPETDYPAEARDREILAEDEWEIRTEEAVNALARAVFLRGGQLAFRHHALLTPFVLEIARDYATPPPAEPLGIEPRSTPERRMDGEDTAPVMILAAASQRRELSRYSRANPLNAAIRPPAFLRTRSLFRAVCIGGTTSEALSDRDQIDLREVPSFAIVSTGGIASELAVGEFPFGRRNRWADAEQRFASDLGVIRFTPPPGFRRTAETPGFEARGFETPPDFRYAIYPLLMAEILDSTGATATQHG
jgi:hypothetical protein